MNPEVVRPFQGTKRRSGHLLGDLRRERACRPPAQSTDEGHAFMPSSSLWTGRLTQRRRLAERKPARGYADKGKLSYEHNGKD